MKTSITRNVVSSIKSSGVCLFSIKLYNIFIVVNRIKDKLDIVKGRIKNLVVVWEAVDLVHEWRFGVEFVSAWGGCGGMCACVAKDQR